MTLGSVKQMLAQKRDGSVGSITTSLAVEPIAGVLGSVPIITEGGVEAVTRSLAIEYAKEHIRFSAVAPGIVDTPMHVNESEDFLRTLSPMGTIPSVRHRGCRCLSDRGPQRFGGGAARGRWRTPGPLAIPYRPATNVRSMALAATLRQGIECCEH